MTKANVGMGVLSIPYVFMTIGIVPGCILLVVMGCMVAYAASILQDFKINHPEVYNYSDVGYILFGKIGREYFAGAFVFTMFFGCGSAIVSISVALNAMTAHATCTQVFIVVAAVCGFMLCSIRTLGQIAWLGWVGCISILVAILTLTIAVGVQDRPAAAPPVGPWERDIQVIAHPPFAEGMTMVNNVLFSYGATSVYFGIISEMRDVRQYKKVMYASEALTGTLYLVIGNVVYHFTGQYVSSPSLGSAGPVLKKVCYGLATPALLVTLTLYAHIAAKYIFVRLLSGSRHLTHTGMVHWSVWLSCTFGTILVGYILASAIPSFNSIISFIGSLFTPSMVLIPFPLMWWHDNWRYGPKERRNYFKALVLMFIFFVGVFITIAGTYASITEIIATKQGRPWSCKDNSGTVKD
ncbi:hypothetical protein VHUM_04217 [Vanrija humicola]|uniref:Amino acid transporter transmembrane domain-containing protein n=1 Tax=Vanrija humicola TaxID=5417 RepID=A0A7D8Z5H7_VANHU|nr:hypothetical protein VHUM_04217 [Vanrija humicola]